MVWALECVGIVYKRSFPVSALSGDEKQRVTLTGALASKAECLILDEPTAMLDPEGRLEVAGVLRAIHELEAASSTAAWARWTSWPHPLTP